MKKLFAVRVQPAAVDVGILLIRLVMGAAFVIHGWGKIQTPLSWMPPDSSIPGVFQLLAAVSEFGGGLALILGLLSRLGSLGLAFTMLVATAMHLITFHDTFVNTSEEGGSYELSLLYFVIALFLVANGPGRFSIDKAIFGER